MRALIKLFVVTLLLAPLAFLGLAWFGLANSPLVDSQVSLSHADMARARGLLRRHDPRRLQPGADHVIEISSQDLNLAANYVLRQLTSGDARLTLQTSRLDFAATLALPYLPRRRFLNLHGTVDATQGSPRISQLHLGALTMPAPLVDWGFRRLLRNTYPGPVLDSATDLVRKLQIQPEGVRLDYRWDPAVIEQARTSLLSGTDRAALRHYHDRLVELHEQDIGRTGSLLDLLGPLFASAQARSVAQDPIGENGALLTLLGTWASGQNLSRLVPDSPLRPSRFRLRLRGRQDFAQHFLTSAALAARGDSTLSDAIGLFKEIADSDRGSGFSFADIAADRAGTRFGELAVRSTDSARQVQRRLTAGVAEQDLMPPADDLPEELRSDDFERRFGHIGSPAYLKVMGEIERRINACAFYHD